jgi:hypothetical protein
MSEIRAVSCIAKSIPTGSVGMKLEIGHLELNELLELVQSGELALPEFQRDFVWRPVDVTDLLCSVARKWPIGSFLVMDGKDKPFALRPLEQSPPLKEPVSLIVLDGQQRCTSFYHAFTDNSPDVVFYLQFPEDWTTFEDEQISYKKKQQFAKQYPTLDLMAADRVIKISDLHDDERFELWKEHLGTKEERQNAVAFRSNQIAGLKDISIPHSKLSGDPDLRAVAKIFETINRTGKRLDTFDLLVARLYPYDFKLRDKWEQAKADNPVLDEPGFNVEGIEILKLIALRRYSNEVSSGLKPSVKGVKQSDVLLLEPDTVKNDWDVAISAYIAGLQFLTQKCGVASPSLLPQPSLPLTVGYFLAADIPKRQGFLHDLLRWYWATCFRQTYAQAANTQVLNDVKELRAWNAAENAQPSVLSSFSVSDESLLEGRRLNEMLLRGILGFQIASGVKDWCDGTAVASASAIEIHHVFPDDVLNALPSGHGLPKDPILNFVAISASTNKRIRNETPSTVMARNDIKIDAVESHGIMQDWVEQKTGETLAATIDQFLANRLFVVKKLIAAAVVG